MIQSFSDVVGGVASFFTLLKDTFFILPAEVQILCVVTFGLFLLFGVARLFL